MEMKLCGCHDSEYDAVLRLRRRVFVLEQGVKENEEEDVYDTLDTTEYLLLTDDGEPAGTGRLVPLGNGAYKIGRIALLPTARGRGTGKGLVNALCDRAAKKGATVIYVDAQLHAVPFYEKCGFLPTGEKEITDRGIVHLPMVKHLKG